MTRIPSNGVWKSAQNGEQFGDIAASRNINLVKNGVLGLSPRAMSLFSYGLAYDVLAAVDPGMQGTVIAACTGIGNGTPGDTTSYVYWLTSTGNAYATQLDILGQNTGMAFSATNAPAIGTDSDIVMFQGKPHVSGGQYVSDMTNASGNWTARRISGLTTGVPHPLCVLEQLNQLAVGNANQVKTYDTSYANQNTLTLPNDYYVTSIRWRQNYLYIGTRHINGGEAKLFLWNGTGSAAQNGVGCGADWIFSLCEYESRMLILTSAGQIRSFNSGGFDDVANFPVFYTQFPWQPTQPLTALIGRAVNRGMTAIGKNLYININGSIASTAGVLPGSFLPNQPSGLWHYNPQSGLSHKAAPNFDSRLTLSPTTLAANVFSFSTAHQASTGDAVYVSTDLPGLNTAATQVYYAIVTSTTAFKLALTPLDARAGNALTAAGSVANTRFLLDRYETLGKSVITQPGAVVALGGTTSSPFSSSQVIFGAGYYDSVAAITKATLCSLGMGRNRGSFTTARITAPNLGDFFQKFAGFVESLMLDTDQIILKYRSSHRTGMPTALAFSGTGATWLTATTFSVDSTQKNVQNIQVGDELDIVQGAAAGYTCHVNAIDTSAPTYVFTVDETMPVSTGTFDFIADNWTKGPTFDRNSLVDLRTGFHTTLDQLQGKWAQFKIEMRGRNVAFDELHISNAATK